MAQRPVTITQRWPGIAAAVLVLVVTFGTLAAVVARAETGDGLTAADWSAIRFTLVQALWSAAISVALAILAARALARRRFRGRGMLVSLLGAPFLLPTIVAIIGLLAVFGRSGLFNQWLGAFGLPAFSVYGFHGVILAHVFFNLPLATRLILQGWLAIPAERFRLVASTGASVGRLLEWPMLRAVVPNAFLVIFLICLTSFAVALTLGGGPKATTVELAIYQALRFDFDLGRAALLAAIQFGLCAVFAIVAWRITQPDESGGGLDRVVQRLDLPWAGWDAFILSGVAIFILLPLSTVVWRGLPSVVDLPPSIWFAAARSVAVALASAALCLTLALALAITGGRIAAVVGVLPLAASALVVGTGAFLILQPFISPTRIALPLTAFVNAVFALPFALRAIVPSVQSARDSYDNLSDSLGLSGLAWLRIAVLPRIRAPLGFAAGLAAALSMGDLGVITLFAGDAQETLPLAMYRLMGAYQMTAAAGAGIVLLCLTFGLFWICDMWGRKDADLG